MYSPWVWATHPSFSTLKALEGWVGGGQEKWVYFETDDGWLARPPSLSSFPTPLLVSALSLETWCSHADIRV